MPIALTPEKRWDYVLIEDRQLPKNKQTVFKLKALSGEEWLAMQNLEGTGLRYTYALSYGLTGWENLKDKIGNPIPYLRDEEGDCDKKNFDYFKPAQMVELVTAILARNMVTEEEAKNSESPDASSQES